MTTSQCMTTKDLFLRSVRRYPQKTAVIDGTYKYSYSELNHECNRLANGLLDRHVGKGDRIGLLTKNCKEFVISYPRFLRSRVAKC